MATVVALDYSGGLYTFDTSNPSSTATPINTGAFTNGLNYILGGQALGIAYRPSNGELYVASVPFNGTSVDLYTVNLSAEAVTYVGSTGNVNGVYSLNNTVFTFNPRTDQIVFAQGNVNIRIDPDTGALIHDDTALSYSPPVTGPVVSGAYAQNGTLYEIAPGNGNDYLAAQNGAGGVVSAVGPLGSNYLSNSTEAFTVASASEGIGALRNGPNSNGIYSISLSTGAVTQISAVGPLLRSMAIAGVVGPTGPGGPGGTAAAPVAVVGSNSGGAVQILNPQTGAVESAFAPFSGFQGAVKVATGQVNGVNIVVAAAVYPQGPVKVFDAATGTLLRSFYAFPGFDGTVNVAVGDVTGSGNGDIIVVANGANGALKVFDEQTGALVSSFLAYPNFAGDVTVAAGDLGGTGVDQIVTVAAHNGNVRVFNLNGSLYSSPTVPGFTFNFNSFVGFNGDVSVALGDLTGDGFADLILGSGAGSRGEIRVYNGGTGATLGDFFAFPAFTKYGVNVAAAAVHATGPLGLVATPAGPGTPTDVQTFDAGGNPLGITFPAFANYAGGADIAATHI
jgi:hypothetical protein